MSSAKSTANIKINQSEKTTSKNTANTAKKDTSLKCLIWLITYV